VITRKDPEPTWMRYENATWLIAQLMEVFQGRIRLRLWMRPGTDPHCFRVEVVQ
jgi:hypothetical protein